MYPIPASFVLTFDFLCKNLLHFGLDCISCVFSLQLPSMWLSASDNRRPPSSALVSINHLRTRIRKRSSKYTFYKPKSKRKDSGSERVDWVFVGFPKAPPSTQQDLDQPLTFEPLRPSNKRPLPENKPPSPNNLPINPVPPPLPPRALKPGSRPPRPVSLYASLSPIVHPTDEYAQINRSHRKRPKSNELPPPVGTPPDLPSQYHFSSPPPIPRHFHGSGIPIPLPDSPPAPPLPPHATPSPLMPDDDPPPLPARNSSNTG